MASLLILLKHLQLMKSYWPSEDTEEVEGCVRNVLKSESMAIGALLLCSCMPWRKYGNYFCVRKHWSSPLMFLQHQLNYIWPFLMKLYLELKHQRLSGLLGKFRALILLFCWTLGALTRF